MDTEIANAFLARSNIRLDHTYGKIAHCLDQLSDDDIWWTPREGSNSVGILLQHLMGNLRQWALSGLGGEPDVRTRALEFSVERKTPKIELQAALGDLLQRVKATYSNLTAAELLEPRRIQGFDTTVLDAIYDTVSHLDHHAGQILYITRLRLGDAYKESWKPANREQGA